jgi:type I restriction enzyme M protein
VNHSEIVSFLWGVADLIHDTFKRGKYQDVILPLTILRRLDCVLADKKEKVLGKQKELRGKGLQDSCSTSPSFPAAWASRTRP